LKKKLSLIGMAGAALLLLTACGTSEVTSGSSGIWDQIVYGFAQVIRFLSFGGLTGIGLTTVDECTNQV